MASTRSTDQRSNISLQSTSNDFVRAPDAAKMAQLMQTSEPIHVDAVTRNKRKDVSSVFAIGSGSFKAKNKKEATLEGLYGRPTKLMYSGSFYELRQKGKQEDKWLLINVQAENVFNSHILNRDVWSDECIVDMVNCNFIFWQTQNFSEEGKVYAERYNVCKFPHIAILDPRTGGLVWSKEDIADKTIIAEYLQDFISDSPSPNTSRRGKIARGASLHENTDDVLSNQAAKASNQPTNGSGSASSAMNTLFGSEIVRTVIAGEISSSELNKQSDNVLLNFLDESRETSSSSSSEKKSASTGFEVRLNSSLVQDDEVNSAKTARLMLRFPDGKKSEKFYKPDDYVTKLVDDVSVHLVSDKSNIGRRFDIWYGYPVVQLSLRLRRYSEKMHGEHKDQKFDETNTTIHDLELPGNRCEVRLL